MGIYIDPTDETKELWLMREGTPLLNTPTALPADFPETVQVCLVRNAFFTAAGIVYSESELQAFADPYDPPKQWFEVPKEKVLKVQPDFARYI